MSIIDKIKEQSYEGSNKKFNELKKSFLEMSQIKSEFDMEKLTAKKNGNFPAHNYHFLMRQYSLTLGEVRRMYLDKEEKIRLIEDYKKSSEESNDFYDNEGKQKYYDIEIKRLENNIDQLEIDIANKAYRCDYFEKLRLKLIEINGGQEPTNEQYQKEEPDYIKWFLEKEMYHDLVSRQTGLRIGVIDNIEMLEDKPLINEDFQRKIDKQMNLDKYQEEFKKNQELDNFYSDKKCIE